MDNSHLGSVSLWLQQVQHGESAAQQKLWEAYYTRLVRLARAKLQEAPRRAADEEDVALSAFNGLFQGIEAGRFPQLDDRNDLWRVLVTLTKNKAINQLKHEGRQKRGGGRVRGESVFRTGDADDQPLGLEAISDDELTPDIAADVADTCGELLEKLRDEKLQKVATWKLEGYANEEIADRLDCNVRTVERKLSAIRELWSQDE